MNNKFEIFNTNISIPNLDSLKENSFNAVRLFCCLLVIVGHCFDISGIQFRFRSIIDMHISPINISFQHEALGSLCELKY